MMHALEPLADLPGVELVMLATKDGVPIASCGKRSQAEEGTASLDDSGLGGGDEALAAMALSWLGELQSSTSPLGWGDAERVLLRCARGSLVMQRCRGAVMVLWLAPGVASEDIRLPMAGAVARIERSSRPTPQAEASGAPNPPGALPSSGAAAADQESFESSQPHQEKA